MNDKQPEALRLADLIEQGRGNDVIYAKEAAAELRRLHGLNAELVEALQYLMEWQVKNVNKWHNSAYDHAAEVIAKATGNQS